MSPVLLLLAAAGSSYVPAPRSLVLNLGTAGLGEVRATAYASFTTTPEEEARACAALGLERRDGGSHTFECRGPMRATALLERHASVPVGRLLAGAFATPLDTLSVSAELPDTPRTACDGLDPTPTHLFARGSRSYGGVPGAEDDVVRVAIGYPAAALGRLLVPPLFLVPLVAIPWLAVARPGRATAARTLGDLGAWLPWYLALAVVPSWGLWLGAVVLLDVDVLVALILAKGLGATMAIRLLVMAVPPLAATLAGSLLCDAAAARRLGSPAPVRSLVAAWAYPLALVLPVVVVLARGGDVLAGLGIGLLAAFTAMMLWIGGVDIRSHAVTDGPLGRLAEAFAADHGLPALALHVAPASRALPLRAAVGQSRRLVLAGSLVARLAQDEMEALLCLEMVRRRRAARRLVVGLATAPALTCVPPIFVFLDGLELDIAVRALLACLLAVPVSRELTRRELLEAAALLPAPGALERALAAVMAADGWSATWYPWDRRLWRLPTLARQIERLAGEPVPLPVLPPLVDPEGERELGPTFRRRVMVRAFGRHALLAVAPPLVAALAVQPGHAGAAGSTALLAAGALASVLATSLLSGMLPVPGFRRALRRLRARLAREGLEGPADAAAGVSGGAQLRIHDGFYELDYGLLLLDPDRMAFAGELHRFVLHRDEVTHLREEAGAHDYVGRTRLHLEWCSRDGRSGTLHLRGKRTLVARVRAWRQGAPDDGAIPAALAASGPPDLPHDAGSRPPAARATLASLVVIALVAAAPAHLAGLPAAAVAYVALTAVASFGIAALPAVRHARAEARREWGLP